ncbi:hypothetical protein K0M31_001258 [Melipona bicolor]|uniref:HTH CENPB-type domain-containing protein n=1 Tax=Melipona bicolor TaxID=60889 RepID=A0AA40GFG9_9HYME|nr:hypothetical protein K0M31_001258 [Melipona bicolor]
MDTPITVPILCEKALELSAKKLGGVNFSSNGWLRKFRRRYVIRLLNIQGEKLSANAESAEGFQEYIQNLKPKEKYLCDI